jgi:hypothetical protein
LPDTVRKSIPTLLLRVPSGIDGPSLRSSSTIALCSGVKARVESTGGDGLVLTVDHGHVFC